MEVHVFRISSAFPFASIAKHSVIPSKSNFPISLSSLNLPKFSSKMESQRRNDVVFDDAAYEAERHRLDAESRKAMAETSETETQNPEDPKAWKWVIRKRVWNLMEAQNIAQFPRPVHHRIPNFIGASVAADKLSELEEFKVAKCVKVNPDTPQKQVRFLTLNGGKQLLTPQPRLRTGFFSVLENSMLSAGTIKEACTSAGVAKYGRPIGLEEKIKVDLIVIGSVAVDPKTGARLGKGEGFAELEYGMLRYMGAIDDSTPVVTSVHDEQLVDDIPIDKLFALVAVTKFAANGSAIVHAYSGGKELPDTLVKATEKSLGFSRVYWDQLYVRILTVAPWITFLFALIATVVTFAASRASPSNTTTQSDATWSDRETGDKSETEMRENTRIE